MKKHVEVEGGELAIRNKKGDVVIIPKGNKKWVEMKIKEGCHSCIDEFVKKLPVSKSK
jgi:cupin superfamily acireductone dioxygenase involved in methionine salvage